MTDEQRAELKRLAEAATPGPWSIEDPEGALLSLRATGRCVVEWQFPDAQDRADSGFIAAANPAAVLDLLAEREEDQGVIRVWRGRTERAEADVAKMLEAGRTLAGLARVLAERCRRAGYHSSPQEEALRTASSMAVDLPPEHPGSRLLAERDALKAENERLRNLLKHTANVLRDMAGMPMEADLLESMLDVKP